MPLERQFASDILRAAVFFVMRFLTFDEIRNAIGVLYPLLRSGTEFTHGGHFTVGLRIDYNLRVILLDRFCVGLRTKLTNEVI